MRRWGRIEQDLIQHRVLNVDFPRDGTRDLQEEIADVAFQWHGGRGATEAVELHEPVAGGVDERVLGEEAHALGCEDALGGGGGWVVCVGRSRKRWY